MGHDITVTEPYDRNALTAVSCRCGWSVQVPAKDAGRASAEHQASMRRAREIAEEQLAAEISDPTRRTTMDA